MAAGESCFYCRGLHRSSCDPHGWKSDQHSPAYNASHFTLRNDFWCAANHPYHKRRSDSTSSRCCHTLWTSDGQWQQSDHIHPAIWNLPHQAKPRTKPRQGNHRSSRHSQCCTPFQTIMWIDDTHVQVPSQSLAHTQYLPSGIQSLLGENTFHNILQKTTSSSPMAHWSQLKASMKQLLTQTSQSPSTKTKKTSLSTSSSLELPGAPKLRRPKPQERSSSSPPKANSQWHAAG